MLVDGTILKKRFCIQTYGVATAIALVALALSSRCWVRVLFTVISNILQSGRLGYERSRRGAQILYHFPHVLGLLDDSHRQSSRSADLEQRAESRRLRRLNNNRAPTDDGGAFGDFTLKDLSFAGCVAATCSAGFIWALTWVSISQIPPTGWARALVNLFMAPTFYLTMWIVIKMLITTATQDALLFLQRQGAETATCRLVQATVSLASLLLFFYIAIKAFEIMTNRIFSIHQLLSSVGYALIPFAFAMEPTMFNLVSGVMMLCSANSFSVGDTIAVTVRNHGVGSTTDSYNSRRRNNIIGGLGLGSSSSSSSVTSSVIDGGGLGRMVRASE